MFKKNFKPYREPCSGGSMVVPCVVSMEDNNSGKDVIYKYVDLKTKVKPLPPPEMFSLENQLKSGLGLKEVNSVVFRDGDLSNEDESKLSAKLDSLEKKPEEEEN